MNKALNPKEQEIYEAMFDALKNGTAPWVKPWDGASQEQKNALTDKPYKGINQLSLFLANTSVDNRWLTYKQAEKLGYQVKKGAKGKLVQYWMFDEKKLERDVNDKPKLDPDGQKIYSTVELKKPKVIYSRVFNGSDIQGLPSIEKPKQYGWSERRNDVKAAINSVIKNGNIQIEHKEVHNPAYDLTKTSAQPKQKNKEIGQ